MFDNKGYYDGWGENRFKLVKDDPVVAAKELLEKNGYKVERLTNYQLNLNGAKFDLRLSAPDMMIVNGYYLTKENAVTLMEYMQKLMDQMV